MFEGKDLIPVGSGVLGGASILFMRWLANHDKLTKLSADMDWVKAAITRLEERLK